MRYQRITKLSDSRYAGAAVEVGKPAVDRGRMCVTSIITTQSEDRSRDIVLSRGISTANFANNPVCLFEHGEVEGYKLPIAKAEDPEGNCTVKVHNDYATATRYYVQRGPAALLAQQIFTLIEDGFIRGTSIGFRPIEVERRHISDRHYSDNPDGGLLVKSCELLEISDVILPDNVECQTSIASVLSKGYLCGRPLHAVIRKSLLAHSRPRPKVVKSGWDGGKKAKSLITFDDIGVTGAMLRCLHCDGIVRSTDDVHAACELCHKPLYDLGPCPKCGSSDRIGYPRSHTERKSCGACHHQWEGVKNPTVVASGKKSYSPSPADDQHDPWKLSCLLAMLHVAGTVEDDGQRGRALGHIAGMVDSPDPDTLQGPADPVFKSWVRLKKAEQGQWVKEKAPGGKSDNRWRRGSTVRYFPSGTDPNQRKEREAKPPRATPDEVHAEVKDYLASPADLTEESALELAGRIGKLTRDQARGLAKRLGEEIGERISTSGLKKELVYHIAERAIAAAKRGPKEGEKPAEKPAEKLASGYSLKPSLSVGDVAKMANVAPRTVMKWVDSGHFTDAYRDPTTGNRSVSPASVAAFFAKHGMAIPPTLEAMKWENIHGGNAAGEADLPGVDGPGTGEPVREPVGVDGGGVEGRAERVRGGTGPVGGGDDTGVAGTGGEGGPVAPVSREERNKDRVLEYITGIKDARHTVGDLSRYMPLAPRGEDIQTALDALEKEGKIKRDGPGYVHADWKPKPEDVADALQDHLDREYAKIPRPRRLKMDRDEWEQSQTEKFYTEQGFTGKDSQGREWVDGELVAAKEESAEEKPTAPEPVTKPAGKKPPATAEVHEADAWDAFTAAYAERDKQFNLTYELIKIPHLYDEAKQRQPNLTRKQFGALLQKWQSEDKLVLQVANDPQMEPRSSEGIWSDRGLLYYVELKPDAQPPARAEPTKPEPDPAAEPEEPASAPASDAISALKQAYDSAATSSAEDHEAAISSLAGLSKGDLAKAAEAVGIAGAHRFGKEKILADIRERFGRRKGSSQRAKLIDRPGETWDAGDRTPRAKSLRHHYPAVLARALLLAHAAGNARLAKSLADSARTPDPSLFAGPHDPLFKSYVATRKTFRVPDPSRLTRQRLLELASRPHPADAMARRLLAGLHRPPATTHTLSHH